jgi:hypothetical protein
MSWLAQIGDATVWSLFRILMDISLLKPIVRPITRFFVGAIAVPMFRVFTRKVLRFKTLDAELEKDLEQWFRGAVLLLFATQNMETMLFPWVKPIVQARLAQYAHVAPAEPTIAPFSPIEVQHDEKGWILLGLRVMLAIGVVQMMPDQELFAVIHHGPPKLTFDKKSKWWPQVRSQAWPMLRGHLCVHLNRSSPVFAILAAIAPGTPGWVCYTMALIQYLIIGLVTSRDKALNVLQIFDETVERRRQELIDEFALNQDVNDIQSNIDTALEIPAITNSPTPIKPQPAAPPVIPGSNSGT